MKNVRLGIDVGGTFTDFVALSEGEIVTAKVPSTPRDQSEGVMNAVESSSVEAESIAALAHGMTVATNALLERRGARTALVTTEGFRDIIEIARQNRPSLYDLSMDRPPPLVPRELRFTVKERMEPGGTVEALDEESLEKAISEIEDSEVESVAVCLLFSF
ncbi:MAG: hydantoinase/oxoprolinase family protein, partial [Actinomycetota bacterium]|nr:hydantoinase/oxoprolinase family protein [Actinomycetota bacterium]